MSRLENKIAFITGAARGIGKGIAEAYAREGASLILTDLQADLLQETAEEIRALSTGRVSAFPMDVRDGVAIAEVVSKTIKEFGRIDILVNVAGVIRINLVVDKPEEEWDLVVDTNLKGPFLVSKAVVREMLRLETKGKIVTIASLNSKEGEAYTSDYAASKHGLWGLMKSLAYELAPYHINVNCICPGYVDTELQRGCERMEAEAKGKTWQEIRDYYAAKIPFGYLATPAEIGKVAVFLASSDADYMTGQAVNVCGGAIMH
ncbi:MAG: SDR family NAD(P)-dependent oxidoreductase [Coprothermobacterota bacterium]|nr:SDR family NAD(P)-dependent oxidoreductase [Coprothermobacterota bacterium]